MTDDIGGMARVGRYRVVRTLGTGGMATVYEAVAEGASGFRRRVAIKRILHQYAGDDDYRRRFLDEARIASHLHHSAIVQVLDFGLAGDTEFIVYELVDGIDAGRAVQASLEAGRDVPIPVVLRIVGEVAEALDHAHRAVDEAGRPLRIVHRDVSPGNVLLSWDGDVKLSDFGVAWAAHRAHRTATGLVHGKLEYMAPEQASAMAVDGSADVFALGRTAVALARGEGASVDGAGSLAAAGWPDELVALFTACTRHEPGARPAAREVADAVAGWVRRGAGAGDVAPGGTGRGALRGWLAPIRDGARPSAFDEGLGLLLERLEGAVDGGGTSGGRFAVTRTAPAPTPRTPPSLPSRAAVPGDAVGRSADAPDSGPVERPGTRRLPWRTAATGAAVVALGAVAAFLVTAQGDRTPTAPPEGAPAASATSSTVSPAIPEPAVAPPPPPSASVARPSPPPSGVAAEGPRAEPRTAPRRAKRRPRERTASRAAPGRDAAAGSQARGDPGDPAAVDAIDAPTASELGSGWVRVGGRSLARGRVEVDGRFRGHAPLELELPVGAHRIRVLDENRATVLLEQRIRVSATHRRATPVRLLR